MRTIHMRRQCFFSIFQVVAAHKKARRIATAGWRTRTLYGDLCRVHQLVLGGVVGCLAQLAVDLCRGMGYFVDGVLHNMLGGNFVYLLGGCGIGLDHGRCGGRHGGAGGCRGLGKAGGAGCSDGEGGDQGLGLHGGS